MSIEPIDIVVISGTNSRLARSKSSVLFTMYDRSYSRLVPGNSNVFFTEPSAELAYHSFALSKSLASCSVSSAFMPSFRFITFPKSRVARRGKIIYLGRKRKLSYTASSRSTPHSLHLRRAHPRSRCCCSYYGCHRYHRVIKVFATISSPPTFPPLSLLSSSR